MHPHPLGAPVKRPKKINKRPERLFELFIVREG